MTTYDLWVQRDPRILKAEWHKLVAERNDLRKPSVDFADLPEGASSKENLTEFVWWDRSSGLPVRVAFIAGAIHIEAGDYDAWQFASELADRVNGDVNG
jgi:hypothetical protein